MQSILTSNGDNKRQKMIRVLQRNMNRSIVANELMTQLMYEKRADFLI